MLRKGLVLFVALVVFAGVFGCGGPKPAGTPLEEPGDLAYEQLNTKERFRKYESIGIRPFRTENALYLSTDAEERAEMDMFVSTASNYLVKGFLSEMKDNYYHRFGVVNSDEDAANYDLIIEGDFMEFDRGNAAGRFWGVGGAARASVRGTMTETATGKVVVNFNDAKIDPRNLGTEFLMGSCCEEIGGNLSDFLEEVY